MNFVDAGKSREKAITFNEDALDVLDSMIENKVYVDMIFTDPHIGLQQEEVGEILVVCFRKKK